MDRRKFLKFSAVCGGTLVTGSLIYRLTRPSDPLHDFYKSTEKVLATHFGRDQTAELMKEVRRNHASLVPSVPYIGGEANMFTDWLAYGVYYLALYNTLKPLGGSIDEIGRLIYETYEVMADYPKWFLRLVGKLKYGNSYAGRLRSAAGETQKRQYPGSWVCTFIDGDGQGFDYGLDISECGICRFYREHNSPELAPYMCLSDYVVSKAFKRGLVRYQTIAEGSAQCDFRYKRGRDTFVYPLRNGWPPHFAGKG